MKKFSRFGLPLVFAIFGVILAFSVVSDGVKEIQIKQTRIEAQAVITDIMQELREDPSRPNRVYTTYCVMVRYKVNGRTYTGELDYYSSGMHVGDEIPVYCDPNAPENFIADEPASILILECIVAAVFIAIGVGPIYLRGKFVARAKRLKESGRKVTALVKEIEINYSTRVNGMPARHLICEIGDPSGTGFRRYRSEAFFKDLGIKENTLVDIYIDPNNPSNYFIDMDSIHN